MTKSEGVLLILITFTWSCLIGFICIQNVNNRNLRKEIANLKYCCMELTVKIEETEQSLHREIATNIDIVQNRRFEE